MNIYLDMDGVVADFDRYAFELLGVEPVGGVYPQDQWKKIAENPRLYRDLPECQDADRLVNEIRDLARLHRATLTFLTAVPKDNDMPWAFYDKVNWAADRFPDIPVWFGPYSRDKQIRAAADSILIDDRKSNIDEWQAAGGHGILYVDAQAAIDQLSKVLRSGVV